MRRAESQFDVASPDRLLDQLCTLSQLQRRADTLRDELAALKKQMTDEVIDVGGEVQALNLAGNESILLADDHAIVRSIAQEILEGFGYHVLAVCGHLPEEVVHHAVDLVLLDLPLLDADHLERLQRTRQLSGAKLIVCTPLPDGPARHYLREQGVSGFVSKPFVPLLLGQCIRHVLDSE